MHFWCREGVTEFRTPKQQNFNLRWVASTKCLHLLPSFAFFMALAQRRNKAVYQRWGGAAMLRSREDFQGGGPHPGPGWQRWRQQEKQIQRWMAELLIIQVPPLSAARPQSQTQNSWHLQWPWSPFAPQRWCTHHNAFFPAHAAFSGCRKGLIPPCLPT